MFSALHLPERMATCQVMSALSAGLAFKVVGGNEFDQYSPSHHLVLLVEEDLLAVFLRAEIEVQGGLFQDLYFLSLDLHQAHSCRTYAEFP